MANKQQQASRFYHPHRRISITNTEPSMTKQSFKAECDIHNILKKYQQTGIIQHIQTQQPIYTDLPDNIDYQTSLHTIMQAEDAFATLPSKVRDHFNNSPLDFLEALGDPAQRQQLEDWGIINKPPPPRPADPQASQPSPEEK